MSEYQINDAYDKLNLARGASFDIVKERYAKLVSRIEKDHQRRAQVDHAFDLIKLHEEGKKSVAESHRAKFRSKSERDLDDQLLKIDVKKARIAADHSEKPMKQVDDVVVSSSAKVESTSHSSDSVLFDKVKLAFLDSAKFLRTIKLLDNMLRSPLVEQHPGEFKNLIILAATCPDNLDLPFSLASKAHRDALEQLASHVSQIPINWDSEEEKEAFTRVTRDRLDLFSDDAFAFNAALKRLTAQVESSNPPSQLIGTLHILKSPEVVSTPVKLAACRKVTTAAFKNREAFGNQSSSIAAIQRDIHKI